MYAALTVLVLSYAIPAILIGATIQAPINLIAAALH